MPRRELSQAQILSQFFTLPEVAKELISEAKHELGPALWNRARFIEPSAGDGAFFDLLPKGRRVGIEVDPELKRAHPEFVLAPLDKGGFLGLSRENLGLANTPPKDVIAIGNPPFSEPRKNGRSGIISLEFVNHAAKMADTIVFVLGNTFRRPNTQAKVDPRLHLVLDRNLDPGSFTLDGQPARVHCVFQIWRVHRERGGSEIPRAPDPFIGMVKRGGDWGGEWRYVKSTDPSANLRVCNWGSRQTVGRMDGPLETRRLVRNNVAAQRDRERSGLPLRNYNPDNSHHYICAEDPQKTQREFEKKRYLFEELADDRGMGNNPDMSYTDCLRIYMAKRGTHYKEGQWIEPGSSRN